MLNLEGEVSGIRWLEAQNQSSETVPSGGLVRFTGYDYIIGLIACDKPNADGQDVLINGPMPMEGAGVGGAVTFDFPAWAQYDPDDGQPAFGETWGAKAGDWRLRKGKAGFKILTFRETDFMALVVPEKGGGTDFWAVLTGPGATAAFPAPSGGSIEAGVWYLMTVYFDQTTGKEYFASAPVEFITTGTSNQNRIIVNSPPSQSPFSRYRVYMRVSTISTTFRLVGPFNGTLLGSQADITSQSSNTDLSSKLGYAWQERVPIAVGEWAVGPRSGSTSVNPAFDVRGNLFCTTGGGAFVRMTEGFENTEPMKRDYRFAGGFTGQFSVIVETRCIGTQKFDYLRTLGFEAGRTVEVGSPKL